MKDIIHKTNSSQMEYHHSKSHTLVYVAGIFAVLVIIAWIITASFRAKRANDTSQNDLRALEANAGPVLTTPEQQAANMNTLRSDSTVQATSDEQEVMLNSLKQ